MSSLFQVASFLLCLLAIVVFAAVTPLRRRHVVAFMSGGCGAAALMLLGIATDPALIGGVVIAVVCLHVWSRLRDLAAAFGLGMLVVSWQGLLVFQGLPQVLAIVMTLTVVIAVLRLAQRTPTLTSPLLQIEAMLLLFAYAVLVAAVPTIVEGWHSAIALNARALGAAPTPAAAGNGVVLWLLCSSAILLGACYTMWERRRRC